MEDPTTLTAAQVDPLGFHPGSKSTCENKEILQKHFQSVKAEIDQIVTTSLNYQINNSSSLNSDFSE